MKRIVTVAAALALAVVLVSPAVGQYMTRTTCIGIVCSTQTLPLASADAKIIQVPQSFDPEVLERDAKWERFCKPVIRQDALGVRRYTYAKDRCEYGRDE